MNGAPIYEAGEEIVDSEWFTVPCFRRYICHILINNFFVNTF